MQYMGIQSVANTNTRQTNRTPVTLKIKFKSSTLDEFIERYAVDISHGGIFIRTKDPLSAGTTLKFEFLLKDATLLIAGDGTVVWTREHDPTRNGVVPGMGVRFDKISSESQKTLDRVLAGKSDPTSSHLLTQEKSVLDPIEEDDDPAGGFIDSPTRVAPAGLVNSLTQSEFDEEEEDEKEEEDSPLPKAMPFQSDSGDFDESAFSESTRVVGVDQLLASAIKHENEVIKSEVAEAKPLSSARDYEDPFGDLNEAPPSISPDVDIAKPEKPQESKKAKRELSPLLSDLPKKNASEDTGDDALDSETSAAIPAPKVADQGGGGMAWIAVAAIILIIAGVG